MGEDDVVKDIDGTTHTSACVTSAETDYDKGTDG